MGDGKGMIEEGEGDRRQLVCRSGVSCKSRCDLSYAALVVHADYHQS
jgi:hypothetical protein